MMKNGFLTDRKIKGKFMSKGLIMESDRFANLP